MIQLRDYQQYADDLLWTYFHSGRQGNPLVLEPTGVGKSVNIAAFVQRALFAYPSTRAMMLTHVESLISQNAEKLRTIWPNVPMGIHSAALGKRDTIQQVIYAGIQSVYQHPEWFGCVHIVIIDEAHLLSPNDETMYQQFITALKKVNPSLKVIGFTATDWRLGQGRLTSGNVFTEIAVNMTTPEWWDWFTDNGYLARLYSKKTVTRLDDTGIGHSGGEYILSQQQKALDKEEITAKCIEEMMFRGVDRNCWLVFATGVNHCENVAGLMNEMGIDACAIHSKTKNADKMLAAYKAGEYRAAVSMNKLTTGVDVPQIDLIGGMRFTESSGMWVQMLGRGTRPVYAPGYNIATPQGRLSAMAASIKSNGCLVLDFAHNTERLGPINNPVISEPKKGRKKSGQGCPVRTCPVCAEYVHASKRFCVCGYEFTMVIHINAEASSAEVMTRANAQPEPVVELVDVAHVTYAYSKRRNSDKPPTLRVSYHAAGLLRKFEEYICFEHEGGAQTRARNWWRERSAMPIPETVREAEGLAHTLRIPKQIRVWTNIAKPKVMSYEY